MNASRFVVPIALTLVVLLAACGRKPEDVAPTLTSIPIPADSGLGTPPVTASTECWTPEQSLPAEPTSGKPQWSAQPAMVIDASRTYIATVETSAGTFQIQLDAVNAPVTVNNFVCLARAGYFDGLTFHRVVPQFVIQGGDPTGTGSGGPGYAFQDEPVVVPYQTGSVAMANSGVNTNGSQFFVVLNGGAPGLETQRQQGKIYNHFGMVISGMEVVEQIGTLDTSATDQRVTITRVTITEA